MEVKILIKTPVGQGESIEKQIKPFILGFNNKHQTYIESFVDCDQIVWIVNDNPKKVMKISRNVSKFDVLMKSVTNNKMFKKRALSKLNAEDQNKFNDMIMNQTSVQIIKAAEAEELIKDNESIFSKIKNKLFGVK